MVRLDDDAPDGLLSDLEDSARTLGATDVYDRDEQPSNAVLQEDVNGFGQLSFLFPMLFLSVSGMATFVLLNRLVRAQRSTIGTMLAGGTGPRTVFGHYLGYGLVPAVLGGVAGVVVGTALGYVITTSYTEAISVPITVRELNPLTAVVGLAFAIVAALIAAGLPARAAARMSPAEAMRNLPPLPTGRPSVVERLLPGGARLPGRAKLVLRNLGRNRRRAITTVVGVVLALTVILVSAGMLDSVRATLDRQFDEITREDAQVFFDRPVGDAQIADLEAVDGVTAAEPVGTVQVSVESDDGEVSTELFAFERDTSMHRFFLSGGGTATLPSSGVFLGSTTKGELAVAVGETVEVVAQGGSDRVSQRVEGFLAEPLGTFAYASLEDLRSEAGDAAGAVIRTAYLRTDPGVDAEDLRGAVSQIDGVVVFEDTDDIARTIDQFLGLFFVFVGIMLVFGAIMAFAIIFNAMSVNIVERTSEVATMQAAGVSQRTIGGLITTENMLVTLLGIAPGLIVGRVLAQVFMESFQTEAFSFEVYVSPLTYVISAAAIFLAALVSQWPGLRAVSRMDIAKVVREGAS